MSRRLSLPALLIGCLGAAAVAAFPGTHWAQRDPAAAGLDGAQLDELAGLLGGRGCVVKDGYVVKAWGDQAQRGDWASSAKPVLSTMLFFAIEEGLVKGVDQPVADFGWPLKEKDRTMTFRHLGAMTSGYARPEPPGAAWSYNDYAIQLYQLTLFDKVYKADPKAVCEDPRRLGGLGLEDGLKFSSKRRLSASVRDFARIGWFWLNRGRWGDQQLLPQRYFDEYMKPQVPADLPNTQKAATDDYLGIGTYGGDSDHFAICGPGIYGFNWWFNGTGRRHPNALTWPTAPADTVMTIGVRGNCSAMMPGLGLLPVSANGNWGELSPGDASARMNRVLGFLAASAGYRAPGPTSSPAGGGRVRVSGTLKKWHAVTLSFDGPETAEQADPNPFTDYRLDVTFSCGESRLIVPGYYAADGNAAESGADKGGVWRVHLMPDRAGVWTYRASFRTGPGVATAPAADAGRPSAFDGATGSFAVADADKAAPGFLAKGLLRHTGKRYLQFAETGEYYLKGGADSPENLLAFADFDQTPPTHKYEPHARDFRPGDPTWRGGRGRNLIGALNYLAGKGMNSVYFLTMNVKGDGKDVWPWTGPDERSRFDCSKLDQWEIVFGHMDRLGLLLHVVHQEQENDQLLDGGELGSQRRLYYRELIARFGHHPALVWNLGEENTNTDAQRRDFARFLRTVDPYRHPIVVHTFPSRIEKIYQPLLGNPDFDGPSIQLDHMEKTHPETLTWVRRSREAGRPWFVCIDEFGPPDVGVKPDADDPGHDDVRKHALWGNLMAGGSGAEWLFGYKYAHNDTNCEDWRSRDRMWDQTRHAIEFFRRHLPFAEMEPDDALVAGGEGWCLAKRGEVYAVYAVAPGKLTIDLPEGAFKVSWYDPRNGGPLTPGATIQGPGRRAVGSPPRDAEKDWVAVIRRKPTA